MSSVASAHSRKFAFVAAQHRDALAPLLAAIDQSIAEHAGRGERAPLPAPELHRMLRRHPRAGSGFFSRSELIAGYRALGGELGLSSGEARFAEWIRMRPVRTQSGVTPVTVFTRPFPCPGRCIFCPNDVRMPKSYLSAEPGCQRAEQNGFDPYLQTWNRLQAFAAIGHAVDKVEIIVLGGTWSFYPEEYQRWFVKRCFDAMNDLGARRDRPRELHVVVPGGGAAAVQPTGPAPAGAPAGTYNRIVTRALTDAHGAGLSPAHERASWEDLARAHADNERSRCRNVGFVVETRPDLVTPEEVLRLRRLGCTKVQLGIQSLCDRVLELNKRGHDVAATREAVRLLRAAGFKIHAHFMANLLGATPQDDVAGYRRLFDDPAFRPDELKVYPCSLIETAELMERYREGSYRPYTRQELSFVLEEMLGATPRYCRLSRVIRDISSGDIVAGNKLSNFREIAERRLASRGVALAEIRSREIKHGDFSAVEASERYTEYATAVGREVFVELCTPDDRLLGFLRLSLPSATSFVDELGDAAVIRELHVYGASVALGARHEDRAQHRGFGRTLVASAGQCARAAGFRRLAVISAVGTRPYYRSLGFVDGELYQHLALE